MKTLNIHKAVLSAALCVGVTLLSGCLPEDKEPAPMSDAGKLSGAFYAAGLGNVALQIQNKIVSDTKWFSTDGVTLALPLETMNLSMTDLGIPIRSYVCPTGNAAQVVQLTWLDGRDAQGKFALRGIGTDSSAVIKTLRERAGSENVGTFTGRTRIALSDGKTLTTPASCGELPIPLGAPVVAFKIERPARPSQEVSRVEYRTLPCEEGETGTRMQRRTVTYKTTGEIDPTDPNAGWGPDGVGSCIQDVDVSIKGRNVDENAGSVTFNNFASVSLAATLQEQLKMGCTEVTVTSNIRNDKTIKTCNTLTVEGKQALASQEGEDQSDRRTLSCAQSSKVPLTGIINVGSGIDTNYTWESGHAVIVRKVNANGMNDGSGNNNDLQQWEGSDAPGDLTCAGYEEVEIPCSAITEGRAPYTAQLDGTMWHNFNTNPQNHWNVNVWAMSRNYFTGTFQYKNGVVKLKRPITATKWADKLTFKPQVDGQTWTIVKNECVVAQRALYPEKGCAPAYKPNDANNPTGSWYPSNGAGHRPRTIIDDPIQFTGDANTLPSRFQELRNQGYLPQRGTDYLIKPAYLYSYPFGSYAVDMKQWVGNGYHDTLLGLSGIMYGQVPGVVDNNKLVYSPMDKNRFAEPFTCGRDATERVELDAVVLNGTQSNYTSTPTKVGATLHTYREWRGYAYNNGSWSYPSYGYVPDQGSLYGNVVYIDQRGPDPVPEDTYTPPIYTDMGGAP